MAETTAVWCQNAISRPDDDSWASAECWADKCRFRQRHPSVVLEILTAEPGMPTIGPSGARQMHKQRAPSVSSTA